MKKLLTILGTLIWIVIILVGVVSYSTTNNYNDLAAIAFVVIVPLIIIYKIKHSKIDKTIDNKTQNNYTNNNNIDTKQVTTSQKLPIDSNPKFLRTEREKDLSIQFSINHKACIEKYEDEIYSYGESEDLNIDEQIKSLTKAVSAYNKLKSYCCKTKGGTIYFQDMWEHCHNSKNPCFSFIEPIQEKLDFLTKHYEVLSNLDSLIIEKIKITPGLLQKDIYGLIDVELKSKIQAKIRDMEQEGKIKRTKKSNSYLLEITSEDENIVENDNKINNIKNDIPETPKQVITIDTNKSTQLVSGLNIPNEIINLLWIKGGPLENYTQETEKTNVTYNISFTTTTVTEPSLIDLSLLLDTDIEESDFIKDIGYFPSYEKLTPKQRYIYLSWLQDISKPVAMGYVFIFYYGLERHLMFGKYKEAINMINYLQQYHKNNSFYSYSTDAMLISILKNNELSLLKSINLDNASDNVYALVKGVLSKGYSAEDITRLYKVFGFTNNRYIKNQYTDFINAVRDILVEKFSSDYYPLPANTIDNCSKQQLLIVANYSLMHKDRFASAPDISSNKSVCDFIHNILVSAHETVKANNRKKK